VGWLGQAVAVASAERQDVGPRRAVEVFPGLTLVRAVGWIGTMRERSR